MSLIAPPSLVAALIQDAEDLGAFSVLNDHDDREQMALSMLENVEKLEEREQKEMQPSS